jgi:hypothetical protein
MHSRINARQVKAIIERELHHKSKVSLKDINIYLIGQIKNDFTEAHKTRLYNLHPVEYCLLVNIASA